jgi:thioredoxin-like negative regulator of GroEL
MRSKILLLTLIPFITFGQEYITQADFETKVAKGISVVEYWAYWNKANQCSYLKELNDCEVYRINVQKFQTLQKKHNVASLPTLIIFENGKEISRFAADLTFKLAATKKQVQKEIDKVMLSKFQ